jgi:glycosyltransferase involved in cell wall biosynthesis
VYRDQRVVVVMPAYNAEHTLRRTHAEVLAQAVVDRVVVVDDASDDGTAEIAKSLERTTVLTHGANRGYGANQKTCYRQALDEGADIVIMVHADYQYTPRLIPAMTTLIGDGLYDCVLGSRIIGGEALRLGMPVWRYVANRALTWVQNSLMGSHLSELHTGYRAFSRELLLQLPLEQNSDGFLFDSQMLAQVLWLGFSVGEVSCPTRYDEGASSIGFLRSLEYGVGSVATAVRFRTARWGLVSSPLFPDGRR